MVSVPAREARGQDRHPQVRETRPQLRSVIWRRRHRTVILNVGVPPGWEGVSPPVNRPAAFDAATKRAFRAAALSRPSRPADIVTARQPTLIFPTLPWSKLWD